jgi:hypothetical protein
VVFDSRTRVRLELRPARNPHHSGSPELPTWQATLVGDGLAGSVVCPEAEWAPRSLADVLASISEDWRGWEGERTWQSAEAEMRLTFRHNGVNTVSVAVVLEDGAPARWRCEAELEVDPGAFSDLASEARRLGEASLAL